MVSGEEKNIRVIVRVRPNNRRELEQNQRTIIKVIDNSTILFDPDEDEDEFFFQGVKQTHRDITKRVNKKLPMEFDRVFDAESTNVEIFEECTNPLVDSVMNGYNCSVFVYGATGAGKTFTMLGSDQCPGITFLTMRELFNKISLLSESRRFDIGISYLEVYNEQVMNLLTKTGPLKLREDSNGVVVSGLVLKPIHNADELLSLLALGNKNRTQHPTDANSESSRSHAVFQVHIRMIEKKTGQKRTVKLSMIDLAGSERAASTKGLGVRFKEGASINKSLLALGNCINKLADGLKHIPYRDSNLTRILKDSLGGNCQTIMIANVSPSSLTYEDTYNTLKYASRAKKIRTTVRQNIMRTNMPKDYYVKKVSELKDENERLKELNKQLEIKLATSKQESSQLIYVECDLKAWYRKINAIFSDLIKSQEIFFGLESSTKVTKLKIKLLNCTLDTLNILPIDGIKFDENYTRIESSINRFEKVIDNQMKEQAQCRKRYVDCVNDLERLRKEIKETKYEFILEKYMDAKDTEIQASQERINRIHITKIKELYHSNWSLGCEIIQSNYKLLYRNNLIDNEQRENFKKVAQIISSQPNTVGRSVEEIEEDFTRLSFEDEETCDEANVKRKYQENDNESLEVKRRKKKILEEFELQLNEVNHDYNDNDDNIFKRPALLKVPGVNLNETHVISTKELSVEDCNSTFNMKGTSDKSRKKDKDILKNILTEHNVNAPNRTVISKALIKSNISRQNLLNAVAAGINKENKKFSPNRIRKSPRPVVRNITNRALTTAANLLSRHRTKSITPSKKDAETPNLVRINRTASMRTKIIHK